MNKAADLYSECVDVLDLVQKTVLEILESGHALDKNKWQILKMASDIVKDYEELSPEVRDAMIELEDNIKAGEMSIEEALNVVTSLTPSECYSKVDNSKKRLLN